MDMSGKLRQARRVACGGLLLAALAMQPARADFLVQLHTFTSAPSGGATADYNYATTGAQFSATSPNVATGTSDASGLATSASDDAFSYGTSVPLTAHSSAAGNLANGTVHVVANDDATCNGVCIGNVPDVHGLPNFASGEAVANLKDVLHFTVSGAGVNASTVTPITVTFHADGNFGQTSSFGNGAMQSLLIFGGTVGYNLNLDASGNPIVSLEQEFNRASGSFTSISTSEATFVGTYDLIGTAEDVPLTLDMFTTCGDGMLCDFGDTGSVSLTLPDGVSYTSDSGVALTEPLSDVPEPGSLAVFGVGLAGLTMLRRTR